MKHIILILLLLTIQLPLNIDFLNITIYDLMETKPFPRPIDSNNLVNKNIQDLITIFLFLIIWITAMFNFFLNAKIERKIASLLDKNKYLNFERFSKLYKKRLSSKYPHFLLPKKILNNSLIKESDSNELKKLLEKYINSLVIFRNCVVFTILGLLIINLFL